MFAPAAEHSRSRTASPSMRPNSASAGIQFAPRQKVSWPLIRTTKLRPIASGSETRRASRRPIRRVAVLVPHVTCNSCSACGPGPFGHHSAVGDRKA